MKPRAPEKVSNGGKVKIDAELRAQLKQLVVSKEFSQTADPLKKLFLVRDLMAARFSNNEVIEIDPDLKAVLNSIVKIKSFEEHLPKGRFADLIAAKIYPAYQRRLFQAWQNVTAAVKDARRKTCLELFGRFK